MTGRLVETPLTEYYNEGRQIAHLTLIHIVEIRIQRGDDPRFPGSSAVLRLVRENGDYHEVVVVSSGGLPIVIERPST